MKLISLILPEFAFIEGSGHEKGGDPLFDRNVIIHTRSASVMEVFERANIELSNNVLSFKFSNRNIFEIKEPMVIALHYSATLDPFDNRGELLDILKKGAMWYCDYCDWEDRQ